MVDFPARHVCGSIKFASVYICSTMCENWFYNFYHQLWWMGKSQKSRGRKGTFFLYISSFRWWFLLKENPIFGCIDAHSWWSNPGVFCNFPHISCSTPRTLHDFRTWVWKKKIVPQPQIHFFHENTKKIVLKYLLWFLYPMVLTSPSLTKAASQRAQARGVAAPVVPKDVEARWVGRELHGGIFHKIISEYVGLTKRKGIWMLILIWI